MKRGCKRICILFFAFMIAFIPLGNCCLEFTSVEAHSGRTDSSGGHKDNKNKSGLGSYHYHCGGNPAHLHTNGVCPYDKSVKDTETTNNKETLNDKEKSSDKVKSSKNEKSDDKKSSKKEVIKAVQNALNDLGYDCGKADGVCGKKTKAALKAFQEDNGLTVDGKIGKEVKEALKIEEE